MCWERFQSVTDPAQDEMNQCHNRLNDQLKILCMELFSGISSIIRQSVSCLDRFQPRYGSMCKENWYMMCFHTVENKMHEHHVEVAGEEHGDEVLVCVGCCLKVFSIANSWSTGQAGFCACACLCMPVCV